MLIESKRVTYFLEQVGFQFFLLDHIIKWFVRGQRARKKQCAAYAAK